MNAVIETVQNDSLRALRQVLPTNDDVAVLDYPNHFNAGDLLIYNGQLKYLEKLGVRAAYVCSTFSYDSKVLANVLPHGTLLLQGGGNFGDRYPRFQKLREHVITDYPDRKIVQLPQTIDFQSADALRRAQRIYSDHCDLTLMIRDRAGVERTRELFPSNKVVYCPDMAYGVGELKPDSAPVKVISLLKRRDQESVHSNEDLPEFLKNAYRVDWHASVVDNFKWWPLTMFNKIAHLIPPVRSTVYPLTRRVFDYQADLIIKNAVTILSRGEVVVTDRLHAAVCATLMGKPVVMVDNANKKVSAIYGDYLGAPPTAHLAANFDDAAEIAQSLL